MCVPMHNGNGRMSENPPLVSLCVPAYGRGAFIGETLTAALGQTIRDIEVIVVDDQSPDDTREVVRSIKDERLRYFRNEQNLGVPRNLDRALGYARGRYVLLLEDHDLLAPTYLEETLRLMRDYPSVGFVATGIVIIDEKGSPQRQHVERLPERMPGRRLLRRLLTRASCPFSVSALMRRSALAGIDPVFDPRYGWYADQYLWMRMSSKWDLGYIRRPLLRMRVRETDHYLADRMWESCLCLDRIHKDTWGLLHPQGGLKSRVDWMLYECAKLGVVGRVRAGQKLRGEEWTQEDDRMARSYVSPRLYWTLGGLDSLSRGVLSGVRRGYRVYNEKRRGIGREAAKRPRNGNRLTSHE